ncbi:MAG: hypothetical protein KJP00_15615 [Bacteroidia bacterium]|nr:hypothetical protein [Bacteroidia bacterium]
MKRLILLFLVSFLVYALPAQQEQEPELSKEYYLQKSKKQYNTAYKTLAGGVIAGLVGYVLVAENFSFQGSNAGEVIGGILFFGGAITVLASVPTFIKAGQTKRKATQIAYEYRSLQLDPSFVGSNHEHALVVRIALE